MVELRRLAARLPRPVIDPIRSARRTVYVCGSARSGTTWIAELLRNALNARILFEPLNHNGSIPFAPHFRESGDGEAALKSAIGRALNGAMNDAKVNMMQPAGLFLRRVVKDIRPGLLPVVTEVAPDMPVIYLLRHPIEVAVSREQLDKEGDWWGTSTALQELEQHAARGQGGLAQLAQSALEAAAGESSPLGAHVAIWCVENTLALDALQSQNCAMLRYEDLLLEPVRYLPAIESLCGGHLARDEKLEKPSRTSFRNPTEVRRLGKWRQSVDESEAARLLAITERLGMSRFFGTDPSEDRVPLLNESR